MSNEFQEILVVIGRMLLGGLFVVGGVQHFFTMPAETREIAERGIPMPKFVLIAGTVFQIIAGSLLILGLFVPFAALGLVVFTVLASIMLLNFWSFEGPERTEIANGWLSNLAVIGGLLIAAAHSA